MNGKVGGQRPRPRVALLGSFPANDMEHFHRMFPTIWPSVDFGELGDSVDVSEIDLTVIAPGVSSRFDWPTQTHVICFSRDILRLPGPLNSSSLVIQGNATTEEFLFPDVSLPISRRRNADYSKLTSVRGWPRLALNYSAAFLGKSKSIVVNTIFDDGAIITEHHTNSPLAVAFLRKDTKLGVAWLPSVEKNLAAWVELLVTQWAQCDKVAFPNIGDCTASPEWMVSEEEQILSKIQALQRRKQEIVVEHDEQIGEFETKLALAKSNANKGLRRLITAQGKDLVDEVANVFRNIGFDVTDVDALVDEKGNKREDLRLKHIGKQSKEWIAIVEVRGHLRSGGQTNDLLRLNGFADRYVKETGQFPDKRIYVVNGQLELPPSQRDKPMASGNEAIEIFADSDGILIWSVDLFQALKTAKPTDYQALLASIKHAQGRWVSTACST